MIDCGKAMEENNSTSFACSTEDCNLRFATQDHLSAHRKKHGMVLSLGTKNNIFGDQTPTPTRFIRNCEEVGLFQDLQNVNPFEETFRKAVEAGKTGNATFQTPSLSINSVGDDTLHTPHVFPHIIENDTGRHQEKSHTADNLPGIGEEELDISNNRRQAVKVVRQEADTSQRRATLPVSKCNISVVVDSPTNSEKTVASENLISTTPGAVQVILRMLADGRLVQLAAKTVDIEKQTEQERSSHAVLLEGVEKSGNSVIFHNSLEEKTPVNKMSLAKQKLKALLGNHSPPVIDIEKTKKECSNSKLTKAKKDAKLDSQPTSRRSSTICNSENDEDIRRKIFLERNRAAAMRCRERRKSWVADLERRAEQMLTANQQLQLEVTSLKAEVAQLKTLLLAHKDCPVTQAMSQGNIPAHIFDMAMPMSVGSHETKSVSTPDTSPSLIYLSSPHFKKKQNSVEDITFRQNLRKKLRTVSTTKSSDQLEKDEHLSKKRISLDIQSSRIPTLIKSNGENSSLIKCDEYLNTALITNTNEPFSVQDFGTFVSQKVKHNEKPVATQVIQFNPNFLHRENS